MPLPSVPMPRDDLTSLRMTVLALKEVVETLARQRGEVGLSAVTWDELANLKSPIDGESLIDRAQIPRQAPKAR